MEGSNKTKPISKLQVKKLHPNALLPKKGSPLAAGYDLCANEDSVVPKGGKAKISTGLSWACPPNTYARVAPRSGLAWKNSISVGAGVIDEDYRGEVCVILFNHGTEDFIVKYSLIYKGSTIASRRSSSRRSSPPRSRRSRSWQTPSAARADSAALEWPRTRLELIPSVIILTHTMNFHLRAVALFEQHYPDVRAAPRQVAPDAVQPLYQHRPNPPLAIGELRYIAESIYELPPQ